MDRCQSIAWLCLPLLFALVCGCQPSDSTNTAGGDSSSAMSATASDGVPADQILTLMKAVYANADSYIDNGKLLLSYRKDGLLTEEPQRWSTAWSADGKLAMEVFGGHIKADGQRLSCYIYDIDSANLDGQRMVVPYQTSGLPPVETVFRDPIARVFLGGYSELPLNEVDRSLREKLIPAPLSLLTGALPCIWLDNPSGIERLPDETLGQHECYVIRSLAAGLGCDIWIDKSTGLLVQMSLPLKLLDPQVMAAPNITDLRMLARFEDAEINAAIDPEKFQLQTRKNSTPVRSFVTLPSALPAESIGQTLTQFRLTQPDGKIVDQLHFDGKPTALLWLGGLNSYSAIKQLNAMANELPAADFNFGVVYSDSELAGAPTQPHLVTPELTAAMASSDLPMFYDPRLAASEQLAIRDLPLIVLMDGNSRVQFASSVGEDQWASNLQAAMKRVAAGDNLADEMLAEYQRFMTRYKTAIASVDASGLLPRHLSSTTSVANTAAGRARPLPIRKADPAFVARRQWVSRDFKQPGNISVSVGSQNRITVLDGLRTITELDANGKTVSSTELELPEGIGVSRIRSTLDGRRHVLFSPLDRQVFVFDAAWRPDPAYTRMTNQVNAPITDVCLLEDDPDNAYLILATKGSGALSVSLDGTNQSVGRVDDLDADSIVLSGRMATFVQNGQLLSRPFEAGAKAVAVAPSQRFNRVSGLSRSSEAAVFGTAFDGDQWKTVCFDLNMKPRWESPIGSQLFESLIDPIALLQSVPETGSQQADLAVATTQDAVHLFSSQGGWLADVKVAGTPAGVALTKLDGKTCLLVSVGSVVECWALE